MTKIYISTADIVYTNNQLLNPVTNRTIAHTTRNYNSVLNQIEKYNIKHRLTPPTPPTITNTENLINDTQIALNTALHPHLPNLTTDPTPTPTTAGGCVNDEVVMPTPPPPTHNYIYNYEVNCMDGFKYVKEKVINCRFAKDKYSIGDIGLMDELREARKDNMTTLYKFYKDGEEEPLHDRLGISQHKENIFFALPYEITAPQPFRSGHYKFVSKQDTRKRVSKYAYHIMKVTKSYVTLRYKYIFGDVWREDKKFKIRYDDTYNHEKTKIEGWYILLEGYNFSGCDNWRLYFSDLEEE